MRALVENAEVLKKLRGGDGFVDVRRKLGQRFEMSAQEEIGGTEMESDDMW